MAGVIDSLHADGECTRARGWHPRLCADDPWEQYDEGGDQASRNHGVAPFYACGAAFELQNARSTWFVGDGRFRRAFPL
jgi:hypothetical protein